MFGREKPAPNTINDADWRSIQNRAAKANPKLSEVFSDEGAARRQRDADNLFKNALLGVSTADADRYRDLEDRVERNTATRSEKRELDQLDRGLTEPLRREIRRGR